MGWDNPIMASHWFLNFEIIQFEINILLFFMHPLFCFNANAFDSVSQRLECSIRKERIIFHFFPFLSPSHEFKKLYEMLAIEFKWKSTNCRRQVYWLQNARCPHFIFIQNLVTASNSVAVTGSKIDELRNWKIIRNSSPLAGIKAWRRRNTGTERKSNLFDRASSKFSHLHLANMYI